MVYLCNKYHPFFVFFLLKIAEKNQFFSQSSSLTLSKVKGDFNWISNPRVTWGVKYFTLAYFIYPHLKVRFAWLEHTKGLPSIKGLRLLRKLDRLRRLTPLTPGPSPFGIPCSSRQSEIACCYATTT